MEWARGGKDGTRKHLLNQVSPGLHLPFWVYLPLIHTLPVRADSCHKPPSCSVEEAATSLHLALWCRRLALTALSPTGFCLGLAKGGAGWRQEYRRRVETDLCFFHSYHHLSLYALICIFVPKATAWVRQISTVATPTVPSVSASCIPDHLFASAIPLKRILETLPCYPRWAISVPTSHWVTCSQVLFHNIYHILDLHPHIGHTDSQLQGLQNTNTDMKEFKAEPWNPMTA